MSSASSYHPAEAVSEDLFRSSAFSDADAGHARCSCSSLENACVCDHSSPILTNATSKGTDSSPSRDSLMSSGITSCALSAEGDPEGASANRLFLPFSSFYLLDLSTLIAFALDGSASWAEILDRLSMFPVADKAVDFGYSLDMSSDWAGVAIISNHSSLNVPRYSFPTATFSRRC